MKNQVIASYREFNFRRYGNPWVARVAARGKLDFAAKVGGYTGGYNKGEAGNLYIYEPEEGAVYAYGQKDYRGNNGGCEYTQYRDGEFHPITKTELLDALRG